MAGSVEGRAALVTGAASGLGEAIVRRLAAEGASVVVADIDAEGGEAVARDLVAGGTEAIFVRLDVAREADWQAAIAATERQYGRLQILVNNAGITILGSVETLSLAEWQKTMDIDLTGVFLGCKYALPLMRKTGGSIVNMASAAGLKARADLLAYNTAKAAVIMLTKSVALHCAESGSKIRCNAVLPGATRTPILDKVLAQSPDPDALMASFVASHPIGYLGEPGDIAEIVAYLASDASKFATGAAFTVDGGMSL